MYDLGAYSGSSNINEGLNTTDSQSTGSWVNTTAAFSLLISSQTSKQGCIKDQNCLIVAVVGLKKVRHYAFKQQQKSK